MIVRFARHTHNLKSIIDFYTSILNFEVLGSFENHNGYDGVFLGYKNQSWHLEFTSDKKTPKSKFDEDDIFVLYPESKNIYNSIMQNIHQDDIKILTPKNPYWKENGVLIQDCDGYNIIISNLKIN